MYIFSGVMDETCHFTAVKTIDACVVLLRGVSRVYNMHACAQHKSSLSNAQSYTY